MTELTSPSPGNEAEVTPQVLVIDDEADVCTFFRRLLTRKGYTVITAGNEQEAILALELNRFQVALVDLKLPDTDGLTLLKRIKSSQPTCEVIIMTGYSTIKTAVQAIQLGAYEYVEKPFDDIDEIETLVEKASAHGKRQQVGHGGKDEWSDIAEGVGFFVGKSQTMRNLVSLAYKIANKNISVMIQGKTGSGKEILARFIHAASNRTSQPFIAVNCGALPENLLESELFGHERGAFTGANSARRGIFELAHKGTLLLDEIGDASPAIQVKLLRVLETGEFTRVGGEKTIKTDVRVISATNVDLEEAIRDKSFREDLFYRLNVVKLSIPSLAERRDDIQPLAEYLIGKQHPHLQLAPPTIDLLRNYPWPGNIRELANILRRAVALGEGRVITPEHLASRLTSPSIKESVPAAVSVSTQTVVGTEAGDWDALCQRMANEEHLQGMNSNALQQLLMSLRSMEKTLLKVMRKKGLSPSTGAELKDSERDTIRKTLEENRWNITAAAKTLGIARNTLHRKIKLYGLQDG